MHPQRRRRARTSTGTSHGVPRFDELGEALDGAEARRGRDRRLYRAPRADGPQGARGRRARLLREAARRHAGCGRGHRRRGEGGAEGAARRLHPARPSVLDPLRRDRPDARQAARHADEPQPAIVRLVLGGAQESHDVDLADRRLRRALRRRDVPGHAGEAGCGACGRRAAHRRDRPDHGQLRPSAHRLRRRLGRLVRGRLGPDDERDRLLREGHDRAEGLRVDRRQGGGGRRRRSPRITTPTPAPTRCASTTPPSTPRAVS